MTTITNQPTYVESTQNPLSRLFSRSLTLNWEVVVYLVIFGLAIFTRFYNLGDRVMSHDESLHVRFSYNLYNEGNFEHTPLMHGPVIFHAVAFSYYLFGDNDFTARIYTSVLGVMMVMFPLLYRRWLGRTGAVLAAIMILISPLLLYYNRYIREDTPSILFTMIMVYATFMYIDGPERQRRKAYWLYILAAALFGSLASKEVAFIYIAVFGLFLTIYWVVRLVQHYFNIPGKSIFYVITVGVLLAGVAALGMYIVLDIIPLDRFSSGQITPLESVTFLQWTTMVFTLVIALIVGTLMWAFRDETVTFSWLDGFVALYLVAQLILGTLLNVVTAAFFLTLVMAVAYAYVRLRPTRGPWLTVLALTAMVVVVCFGFILIEELSHVEATASTSTGAVPGEEAVVEQGSFRPALLYLEWAVAAAVIGGVLWLRTTSFWANLKRFPEFDVLIIMGTLVLPWLTAFVMKAMGANPTSLPDIARVVAASLGLQIAQSEFGIQLFLGFLPLIPMLAIMIVVGLVWDWKRWIFASLIFHILFAFFFTTVFTNIEGLGTGMIGSLGYWLEQQGVRRGSQPQYYYLVLILPFYEFLPVIGSVLAMVSGMTIFWRYIRGRLEMTNPQPDSEAPFDETVEFVDQENVFDKQKNEEIEQQEVEELPTLEEMIESDLPPSTHEAYLTEGDRTEVFIADRSSTAFDGQLQHVPFLLFVSWWAVFNLIAYTLAGEKMPWLGTHMTLPMILLAGWYFGGIFDRLDVGKFLRNGWTYLILLPLLFVTGFNIIAPFLDSQPPFGGLSQLQLQDTFSWLAVVVLAGICLYVVYRVVEQTGWAHLRAMFGVAVFAVLSLITFRSAWMASFINYDYATEPLVYAHSAPAVKTVLDQIEELSLRTTDGMGMVFAYDDLVSWPYSWYFRNFPNARFMGSSNITLQSLNGASVVVVGEENRAVVEPLLGDNYFRYEYIRMWWPLQDYFGLTAERVHNVFDLSPANLQAPGIREGIFDIWWNRDYAIYSEAVGSDLNTSRWPVRHRMYVYVRRDVMGQVWTLGTGEGTVLTPDENPVEANLCITNWLDTSANLVFGTAGIAPGQLNRPLGLAIAPNGTLYVSEEGNHRINL